MAFPFLYLALALASGIVFSAQLHFSPSIGLIMLLVCLLLSWLAFLFRKNSLCYAFILAATFFLGAGLSTNYDRNYEENALRRFDFNGYADFSGRLLRSPSFGPEKTYLYLKVDAVRYLNKEEKTEGTLRITLLHPSQYPSPLKLRAGDKVKVSAQVLPSRDFRNFGVKRLANLRKNQNIHNHAISKSVLLVETEKERGFSLSGLISAVRLKLIQKIEDHFSSADKNALSREGAVLEALLLGERGRMDGETTSALQRSGLFHLIAISGAHVAILSFLIFTAFRFLRMPKRLSYLLLILLLLFYAFLVEGRASVFRAVIMALAYLIGKLLWKNVSLLNTISFSAFFLLLANPFYLFDMGFELTFAATYSIILFYPRVLNFMPKLPLKMSEFFVLSLTAQLGVLPFLVNSFHRVTFSAILLNFAAIPLAGLVMALGFFFLGLSLASSFLAHGLALGIAHLIRFFLAVARLFDPLPVFSYRIPTPHLATIISYFLFLVLLLLRPKSKAQKPLIFLAFALSLVILISYPFPASSSGNLTVTFLDVGQGDSILVEFPGRKKMLIDGGGTPDDSFDIGEQVVSPFLWSKGIKQIDYLVLTHAHPDHMNGLKAVAENFKIMNFWEAFSPRESPAYTMLQNNLGSSVRKQRIFRGFVHQEGAVKLEALHPEDGLPHEREASNEEALVFRLSLGEQSFLLTADIGVQAESEIMEKNLAIKAQVLKSPHHGSRTSSSKDFLEAVGPQVVVITAGRANIYGVPHPEILERYRRLGVRILRTDEDGAVEISAGGYSIAIRTAQQEDIRE